MCISIIVSSFWESRNYDERYPELVIEEGTGQVLTHPELYFNNVSATVGATYALGEKHKVYFNYSMASRAPNPAELFSEGLHHSAARVELGDLSFHSEIGHKISMTLERHHEKFSFSIQPFVNTSCRFYRFGALGRSINFTLRGSFSGLGIQTDRCAITRCGCGCFLCFFQAISVSTTSSHW